MTDSRIYRVADEKHASITLVRAANAAQAVRHASKDFDVRVASQEDLVELIAQGLKVEDATNGAGGEENP